MASALQQNQYFAQGKADVKPIPLAWFTTPGSEKEPALLLPDYGMPKKVGEDGNGFIRVSHEDAIARLKKITHDTTYAPGKPKGQSLYDWYLAQADTNQEIKSIKEMLVSGGKANSAESFLVNGIFSDKQLAQKVSGMTTQQLMEMGKADQALQTKMQGEQAAEAKRQAEIKTYTDAGKTVPQELLAPGQGEGNGKDGFQVGSNMEQTQASGRPATNVVKQPDGTYAVTNTSGNVLQSGFQNIAQALATQNQITTGGTPQLSGRPDLFAVEPTQAEVDAGIQPIVPQAGMAPVQPTVATPEQIKQVQAGTLPTPAAEAGLQLQGSAGTQQGATGAATPGATGTTPTGTTPGAQGSTPTGTAPGKDFTNYSDLPAEFLNSPDWAVLPDEYKKAFYATWHAQQLTNEAAKKDYLVALQEAEKLADPSFKEALRISQDELSRGISSLQGDFGSKKTTLETRIKNIEEDLAYNKGELDLNQQADLAQQLQKYKSDLFNVQQSAAESGLAFSSPRSTAEAQMATQNEGLITSTKRAYAQKQRQNLVESQRSMAENQQSITDLQRQQQENMLALQRKGETTLGTSNVGQVAGVNQLGGITGSLAEKKQTDVLNLQKVLQERQNPFKFNA